MTTLQQHPRLLDRLRKITEKTTFHVSGDIVSNPIKDNAEQSLWLDIDQLPDECPREWEHEASLGWINCAYKEKGAWVKNRLFYDEGEWGVFIANYMWHLPSGLKNFKFLPPIPLPTEE